MTKVKICGITRLQDALLAQELGAWAIGFIFYPKSRRYIEPKAAYQIKNKLKIKTVGVFVNENPLKINEITKTAGLDYVQMHGLEEKSDCDKLIAPYIKNIRNTSEIETYQNAALYLVDAQDFEYWGGLGQLADWELAKSVKNMGKKLVLSGGLNSKNINLALDKINPDWVDLSSSVEKDFGIKDPEKMKDFFDKISIGAKN